MFIFLLDHKHHIHRFMQDINEVKEKIIRQELNMSENFHLISKSDFSVNFCLSFLSSGL